MRIFVITSFAHASIQKALRSCAVVKTMTIMRAICSTSFARTGVRACGASNTSALPRLFTHKLVLFSQYWLPLRAILKARWNLAVSCRCSVLLASCAMRCHGSLTITAQSPSCARLRPVFSTSTKHCCAWMTSMQILN